MAVISNVVGAVTDTTARVIGRVDSGDSSIRLAVDTDAGFPSPTFFGPQSPDAQDVVDFTATGLTADTQYHFALEVDSTLDSTFPGQFRTFVPDGTAHSFRVAAIGDAGLNPDTPGTGSVLASDRLSNHAVFDTVREADPDLTCHLGDLMYYDLGSGSHGITGGASLSNYRRAYDDVLLQPRQHQLYRETAWVYLWDDHDYGPNNSDGTHSGKDNAGQVYRERVPSYPLEEDGTAGNSAIYHSFQVGRVLFVASDTRYHRDPNGDPQSASKTMLGSAQESWLTNLLASSSAELCVWLMPKPFPSGLNSGGDSWGSFRHERQALMNAFRSNGWVDRLLVLSADMHGLALDHGTAWTDIDGGEGPPASWVCASLDCSSSTPDDHWDDGFQTGRNQYVIADITDTGDQISVKTVGYQGSTTWDFSMQQTQAGIETPPLLDLDYTSQHISPPLRPTDDDQQLRNDVTVSRRGGSSARAVDEDSISEAGLYDESVTLNLAGDDQLADQAGWRVHLGTASGLRYPQVTVDLARNPGLAGDVAAVESGDRVSVSNPLSPPLPPGDIALIAQGYEEELDSQRWTVTLNASPGDPWDVATLGSDRRLETSGSELATAVGASDTSLSVAVTAGPLWVTASAELPLDITLGGEVVTVTAVSGTSSPQTFTVTRSVNGVSKSHTAGTAVTVANPLILPL